MHDMNTSDTGLMLVSEDSIHQLGQATLTVQDHVLLPGQLGEHKSSFSLAQHPLHL
jgi:hypothetical protein